MNTTKKLRNRFPDTLNFASLALFSSFSSCLAYQPHNAVGAASSPVPRNACLHLSRFSIVPCSLFRSFESLWRGHSVMDQMCGNFSTAQSFYIFITDICQPGWSYFGGYCYFTSRACASWLTAESNCSTMSSKLVTFHNQEENVYIQHRHNGERSWIGLNDRSVDGSFVWTNKEISSFRFWAPQQPND